MSPEDFETRLIVSVEIMKGGLVYAIFFGEGFKTDDIIPLGLKHPLLETRADCRRQALSCIAGKEKATCMRTNDRHVAT